MADISKEQAVQLARGCGLTSPDLFKLSVRQASIEEIQSLCQAAFKLGRNAGLEEAKDIAEHACVWLVASAIESLKEPTP